MITENIKPSGVVTLTVTDESGKVTYQEKNNLVVNTGRNFLASAFLNASASPFTHIAVGTGTTPAVATDTTLQTELTRIAFTTASVTANVVNLTAVFGPGVATGTLTESGIFNNVAGGTMFSRVVFSAISKGAADTVTVTWVITVS